MKRASVRKYQKSCDLKVLEELAMEGDYFLALRTILGMLPERLDAVERSLPCVLAEQGDRETQSQVAELCTRSRQLVSSESGRELLDQLSLMGLEVPATVTKVHEAELQAR